MHSPEVARALPGMVAEGLLTPEQAAPLGAIARGEVVSVRAELRALLGLAVTALLAGLGIWIAENREQLGPVPIAAALGLAAAAVLVVVRRRSPPFTWQRAGERDWTLDGLLLLAIGLIGADLGWIESQFTALGESWPLHLLLMSLITGALAVRYDSLPAWSLALATFAAWRGVALIPASAGALERTLFAREDRLRGELLLLGACFFVLGRLAERFDRKRHFEPATTLLALLVAGLGLASGLAEDGSWPLWALLLAGLGAGGALWALRRRRRWLFALSVLWAWIAVTRTVFELPGAEFLGCFWPMGSTAGAIVLLVFVHRRFQREEAA